MVLRPDLLPKAARRIKQTSIALARHPSDLSLWATGSALVRQVVASRLRPRRVQRVPYPVSCLHEEHAHTARASDRGVIFVSVHSIYPHVSLSWFYNMVHTEGWPIHAIMSFRGGATHVPIYGRSYTSVIHASTGVHKAARALQRGEGVVLLQDAFDDDGVPIRLFDRVAPFRLGAARLATMTDSLILPFITLSHRGTWKMHWWPPIDPREWDVEKALADAMARMIHTYPRSWSRLERLLSECAPVEPT